METRALRVSVFFMLTAWSAGSLSTTGNLETTVVRILTDETDYGTCMVELADNVSTSGANCKQKWVTFACDGTFGSKTSAANKLSAAQLAFVTGGSVKVYVDDSKKISGYCWATRVDNIQ